MIDRLALGVDGLKNLDGPQPGVVMNSSEDLIARACSGDQEAYRLLFERHARPVLGFLYNLVGRRDVAEELTQETFVRAYRSLSEFRNQAKFSTWLFGIARNVSREWSRSKEGRDPGRVTQIDLISTPVASESPAEELLGKELHGLIESALQLLDEERRAVFALKVFQQRSYQEIVDITGFSLAKVKIELHRARAEMRQHLRPYLETKI
ncbi:MAG: sigma-70 family RNA polymerase sigma factor [Acidobacteriota bacterium]